MSTMWSMCSMSTGHCSTHAPHVVHDHNTSGSMTPPSSSVPTSGRSAWSGPEPRMRSKPDSGTACCSVVLLAAQFLAEATFSGVLERSLLVAEDVWRLREQMVAQVHDDELGRQRLSGVPRRALRLAAAALGTRGEVEIALPGEVLDLAAAEHRVLVGILEVDVLAVVLHGQQWAQRVGQPLEGDVDRGQADVQVLGVQHDQQEDEHDADVQQQRDALDDEVGRFTERGEHRPHAVGEEGAPAVGQVLVSPLTRHGTARTSR